MTDSLTPDEATVMPTLRLTPAPRIYANSVQLKTSLFDVSMELGIIAEITKDGVVADHVGTIIMSPQHAKALNDLLTARLADYEERFGKLPQLPVSEPPPGGATE